MAEELSDESEKPKGLPSSEKGERGRKNQGEKEHEVFFFLTNCPLPPLNPNTDALGAK